MRPVPSLIASVAMILCLTVPSGAAEPNGTALPKKVEKARDPNEMICESEPMLGSRLAKRRTCMTRSQWAERRALDRQVVERTQTGSCQPTHSSNCF